MYRYPVSGLWVQEINTQNFELIKKVINSFSKELGAFLIKIAFSNNQLLIHNKFK